MGKPKKPRNTALSGVKKPDSAEDKGKKSYSFAQPNVDEQKETDGLQKVVLSSTLEKRVIEIIQESHQNRPSKEVSKRMSSKKLMDVYESLSQTGFKHDQVEKAMSHVIPTGGDLLDALDWLCLYTPNDKLPEGFSETFQEEENKMRPKFDAEQVQTSVQIASTTPSQMYQKKQTSENNESESSSNKNWILQYADISSDEESDGDQGDDTNSLPSRGNVPHRVDDPNEKYVELTAKLLDARSQACQAKQDGDKRLQKEASSKIRKLTKDMEALECHVDFNPALKIKDLDIEKEKKVKTSPEPATPRATGGAVVGAEGGGDDTALIGLFDEEKAALTAVTEKKKEIKNEILDVRNFEYTRQQWTGKSPKQFLIDWVRKHLTQSKPPSYKKRQVRGNLHKCQVTVERKKEGNLVVTSEILTENSKDAEHLGCTLALYHLCKGQSVYQLLPPPFRDVWLEWEGAEKLQKEEKKIEKNKPRDQYLSKLMKKLQLEESKTNTAPQESKDDGEKSWEDYADEDFDIPEKKSVSTAKKGLTGDTMKGIFLEHQSLERYQSLYKTRQALPVSQYREDILNMIHRENVLVIAGETGSGKSTQIPQFILQSFLECGQGHRCNIICTQPRRISAVSLAKRVSDELGEAGPGTQNSFCGYQIRFESKKCSTTCLTYCTTGVLLRQLQLDPLLKDVSHVIVDEVHERTMQSDFLMIVLRTILRQRPDFKVILMSATLDSAKFSTYFSHCPVINIPGRTFPVEVRYIEDVIESIGYTVEEDSPYCLRSHTLIQEEDMTVSVTGKGGNQQKVDLVWTKEDIFHVDKSGLSTDNYSLSTRNVVTRLNPSRINMDLIVALLKFITSDHQYGNVDGAVLIFLPGLSDIQDLNEMLQTDKYFSYNNRYKILALHSVLSSEDQSAVFTVMPPGVRKIVIATNIAETGITIPDVVFVIDAGKAKENRYLESSGMSSLEEVFISKANAKQRQGRAGRVREGYCFRLFTKLKYDSMKDFSVPELLRIPLEELCLLIMKGNWGNPHEFLSRALDPPASLSITKAMTLLQEVGACIHGDHILTPLGHYLAALPVHVRIGKMLIFGALLNCLEPVAVIAAAMTSKSPFVVPMNKRDEADLAKHNFAVACSDHLTLYNAYLRWRSARKDGKQTEIDFCNKSFLKRNSLLEIEDVKKELMKLVSSLGFDVSDISDVKYSTSIPKETIAMVKAVITAGLYPNVGRVMYEAPVDAVANPDQKVCLIDTPQCLAQAHPSSVNRFLKANGLVIYHEKVKHTRVYIRDSSLISPHPILLFGGDIEVYHRQQVVSVDKWIKFQTYARTGVIYRELRLLINDLLQQKVEKPDINLKDNHLLSVIIDLLKSDAR